ncbi:glycosyltransferase family 4 protein [Cellulomonas sp. URHB0016]
MPMLTTLDATPLLGTRTGIGRYVEQLLAHLPGAVERAGAPVGLQATTWTWNGGRLTDLPSTVRQVGRRVPARVVRAAWQRASWPPVELLTGATDVFHGTNFVSPPTRRAREVVTVHDLTYERHAETVSAASLAYRVLVPRAIERGAHVLTPTRTVADQVIEHYGLAEDRVTVTHLGVDEAWFEASTSAPPAAVADLPDGYLVFVGSLDPRKNLPRLVEAYRLLRTSRPDAPALVLAGPAGREQGLLSEPGVLLTGWLSDDELRALVGGARALVLPSVDEGFGLPAIEAFATGRAVVAADIPTLREVVGDLGTFGDPLDVASLADALARVLDTVDDDDARTRRREHARRFSWALCADRTLAAYLRAAS